MDDVTSTIITTTVAEFCRMSGLGHSKVYELLSDGSLRSIKIGKRRLIVIDSFRRLIEQQGPTPRSGDDRRLCSAIDGSAATPPPPSLSRRAGRKRRAAVEMSP